MILFGHPHIESERFYFIDTIEQIAKTPSNATLLTKEDSNFIIAKHCQKNNLTYGAYIESIEQMIIYSNLQCAYFIIKNQELLASCQNIANHYLLDGKVLYQMTSQDKIETFATLQIDGLLYEVAIVR